MNLKAIINRIKGDENNASIDINSLCSLISRRRDIFVYLFYLAVLLTAYAPVFTNVYGYNDDFAMFFVRDYAGFRELSAFFITQGRLFLTIELYIISIIISPSLNDLLFFRLFSVIGIAACACFFYRMIMKLKIFDGNIYLAIFIPLLLMLLPSIQIYAAWASLFHAPIAMFLSLNSYYFVRTAQSETSALKRALKILLSMVFIIVSFGIYQIPAMIFIVPMIAEFCLSKKQILLKEIAYPLIVLFIGMLSSLALVKLVPHLLHLPLLSRGGLNVNPIEIFQWLRSIPLTLSIQNYSLNASPLFTALSKIVIIIAFISIWIRQRDWKASFQKTLSTLFLIVLAIAPAALTSRDSSYRIITIFSMSINLCLLFGLYWIFDMAHRLIGVWRAGKILVLSAFGFLTLFLSLMAQKNIISRYILPFNIEYHAFASELSKLPKDKPIKAAIYCSELEVIFTKLSRSGSDWFTPSIMTSWSAPKFIETIIANKDFSNISLCEKPFIETKEDIPADMDGIYIIDAAKFIKSLQIETRDDL
jgi:hypothetical protein